MKKFLVSVFACLVLVFVLGVVYFTYKRNTPTLVGGPCSYKSYDGICRIISLKKNPDLATTVTGYSYDGYDVSYVFSLKDQNDFNLIGLSYGEKIAGGSVQKLTYASSSLPLGDLFITKYKLTEGGEYPCFLKVIFQGTCSPVMISFEDVDVTDYVDLGK